MRDPRAGPVADLDRVRAIPPGRRSARSSPSGIDSPAASPSSAASSTRYGRAIDDDAAASAGRRARGSRSGPEAVARVARDLFDGALGGERTEQPRGRDFGMRDAVATSVTPSGPSAERARARRSARRWLWTPRRAWTSALAGLRDRSAFHYTASFRDVEPRSTDGGSRRRRTGAADDRTEEFDLAALADDELVEQMHNDLYDGMAPEIVEGTNILLGRGWGPDKVLNDALVEGMRIVGIDFRDGILFVPEVLLAANAMKAGMAILRPLLAETGAEADRQGRHRDGQGRHPRHRQEPGRDDARGRGLRGRSTSGINTDADKFIAALELHKPDILGMSALLTTTMPYMKVVIAELVKRGIRDDYIVLVGGAPLNEEFGKAVGADAYCRDAAVAVETARRWFGNAVRASPEARSATRGATIAAIRHAARHRLRRAGPRAGRAHRRAGLPDDGPHLPAGRRSTTGPSGSRPPSRARIRRARARRLRPDLRRLRRLRHRRPARPRRSRRKASSGSQGAHCYEVYAGRAAFAALADDEPGTFYLTDFLARNFDRLVVARPGPRPPPGAAADLLRQLPARSSTSPRPTTPQLDRQAAEAAPRAWASRSSVAATGLGELGTSVVAARLRARAGLMAGTLTTIWWRDIPAQVIAKDGRQAHKVVLHRASRSRSTRPR